MCLHFYIFGKEGFKTEDVLRMIARHGRFCIEGILRIHVYVDQCVSADRWSRHFSSDYTEDPII